MLLGEPRLLADADAVLTRAGAAARQGALDQPVVDAVQLLRVLGGVVGVREQDAVEVAWLGLGSGLGLGLGLGLG